MLRISVKFVKRGNDIVSERNPEFQLEVPNECFASETAYVALPKSMPRFTNLTDILSN